MKGMMIKIETGSSKHKGVRKLDTEGEEGLQWQMAPPGSRDFNIVTIVDVGNPR